MQALERSIAASPDPEQTARRLDDLHEAAEARTRIESLDKAAREQLIDVIGISNFLFRRLCRYPELISSFAQPIDQALAIGAARDFSALRDYKYRELLRLTRLDLHTEDSDYPVVLTGLSELAEGILKQALELMISQRADADLPLCAIGLGKLGAIELNYSSDIDLIFVMANREDITGDPDHYQKQVVDCIRHLSRTLEQHTAEGFLYRVDLKLRPWGRSGPLAMSVDETEQYYEGSSESWERFAWLRARPVAGTGKLGTDILERLQPFVFLRSLGSSDLDRFLQIKSDMASMRRRRGNWNVKVGDGGIRDIEFFVQMLQIVNGARHPLLRTTNTLKALNALVETGLLDRDDAGSIRTSYLFLRRLENRLQMIDERQTHDLPEEPVQRIMLARSLGYPDKDLFDEKLADHKAVARGCFERILPDQ